MEYNAPSSYRNYLPGKSIRIVIGIIIIIGIAYFTIPWAIRTIKKARVAEPKKTNLFVSSLSGDPTTRDTDGDGVPDWQEIVLGLDINNPQSKMGIPDMTTFQTIKAQVGADTFDLEAGQVTDTDKVSLTIYDALSKDSVKNNGISVTGAQAVTGQELYNYIAAQKKEIRTFSQNDLTVVPGTLESNQAYAKRMNEILADDAISRNGPEKIQAYLDDRADRSTVTTLLTSLQKKVADLLTVPVPSSAASMHVDIINAAQGIYQLVSTYDPEDADPTAKVSTVSLVQDYLISATKSFGYLKLYLSVALDKNGYSQ